MLRSRLPYDRREFGRRRATVAAKVRLFHDPNTIDCSVLNVSEGGALLEFKSAVELPPRFALCLDDGFELACEIRHRNGSRVGVEFTVARSDVTAEPSAVLELVRFAREVPWGREPF